MLSNDPLWYKDAVIYELHVRSFHDSVDNGMGDFLGLTQKLDYLQDLGVTAIWLLPFYPSPLKDDGYDIADYTDIHSHYGTLADFDLFLQEAHRRGLRVITELVINHTSDQHAWFQRARRAPPGSPERDFYVWSDTPTRYADARIIFKDFESSNWAWDPVARAYYWHRFYSHQPDLNFDNPAVWQAIIPVIDFWLGRGVDGMRLDAVPYLFEREGTSCENLPETHEFLKVLRRHVDERFANRMLLAEANQWPEDAAAYFGQGDEAHMAFHFPLMPRMFMAIHQEDRFPIIDILQQTPAIPDNCQWALFLRNHDELTLEMVTDEERDYMYRAYARDPQMRINLGIRRRLAPLLGNNRRKIELMNALLLSLPGTPVIYYGDEIGMGDNFYLGDRNGVRTPMQWSSDRNAGFSRANPQKLYLPVIIDPEYHYEAINVDAQQNNPHSLLWWIKRLIALRKRYRAFGRGSMEILPSPNRRVLAFLRRYPPQRPALPAGAEPRGDEAGECILVVANLSRFAQAFELDLAEFAGQVPVELFGRTEFPVIERQPYRLMLGPHAFYWFALERPGAGRASITSPPRARLPVLNVPAGWESVLGNTARSLLQECLPSYLATRRWFLGHGRLIKQCLLVESIPIPLASAVVHLTVVRVEYLEGDPETYVLPLAFAGEDRVVDVLEKRAAEVVAYLKGGAEGVLYDAAGDPEFAATLLDLVERRRTVAGDKCYLQPVRLGNFDDLRGSPDLALVPAAACENNHTSVVFGQRLVLKLFRRVESGLNPEWEIGRYLMERHPDAPVSPLAGGLEYRCRGQEPMTVAVVHGHVVNEGDAWQYTLDELGSYFERVLASAPALEPLPLRTRTLLELAEQETPAEVRALTEPYLDFAWLLGKRTGELHALLASAELPALAPEPFTPFYQRSIYQSLRNLTAQAMQRLRQRLATLPPDLLDSAHALLQREGDILKRLHPLVERKLSAVRIRCHGDYHLGQVLFTGKDVVLIDFEGDPKRSLSERRIKRSPLRDVASMLRSFDYAACSALLGLSTSRGAPHGVIRPEDQAVLEPWARVWCTWASVAFWKGYLETARPAGFLPANPDELALWGDALLLEKALQELDYELIHRPDWARIPLLGIQQLLQSS